MPARIVVIFVLAVAAQAGDLASAQRQLTDSDPAVRRAGIATLVELDSRRSLDILVQALRRAYKQDSRRQRAFENVIEKATRKIVALIEDLKKRKRPHDPNVAMRELIESTKEVKAQVDKVLAAHHALRPHLTLNVEGASALDKFRSRDAVARLEELAKHEPPGRMRNTCLGALLQHSTPDILPTLLTLAEEKDPRVRALVVRALKTHVDTPAALERLVTSAGDPCWQVRRGAYAGLAALPPDKAIPLLEDARATETGDQLRVLDSHLRKLRGTEDLPAPEPVAFGLPLTSTRVRFVLDLSQGMEKKLPYLREEMTRALDALPDGAWFEIVGLATVKVQFASKPQRMSAATRKRAKAWLRRLDTIGPADPTRLFALLAPDYDDPYAGKRIFEQLPDAVYLVFYEAKEEEAVLQIGRFVLWNRPCGAALHVRALGAEYPRELLLKCAEATGGGLVSGAE